jgi:hypothetical protein
VVDAAAGWLAAHRPGASVLVNLGSGEARFGLPAGLEAAEVVASDEAVRHDGDAVVLPAVSAAVIVARGAAIGPGTDRASSHTR